MLLLAGFVFYGLFFGLIKTVGSLAGVVVGAGVASRVYLLVFGWLKNLAFGHDDIGKVVVFIICFVIINRVVCLIFALLDKAFKLISIIPFLKTINRLGGAALGLIEGGLVLGLLIYVIGRYPMAAGLLGSQLTKSQLVPFLLQCTEIIKPLLPELLKQLKSVV